MENKLIKLGRIIARQNNFVINKLIYQGYSLCLNNWRDVIFSGSYKDMPAVLKIYHEERITREPLDLKFYNQINTNKILIAPYLYKYKIFSAFDGWLIMEKLPAKSFIFKSPLDKDERKKFLELFLIYRRTLPTKTKIKINLVENLPSGDYHNFRIDKWLFMANNKQAILNADILKSNEIVPRYLMAKKLITNEFKNRKMIYCHGHFKPAEIASVDNRYYLTDFAHMKLYPEGYELDFMVWADYLISGNWRLNYRQWKRGVIDWLIDLRSVAKELKIYRYSSLIRTGLIERIMGTILADVASSDKPYREKVKRLDLLYKLFDDLVKHKINI